MLQSNEPPVRNNLPWSVIADLVGFEAERSYRPIEDLLRREASLEAVDLSFSELGDAAADEPAMEEPLAPPPDPSLLAAEAEARREAERQRSVAQQVAAARDEGYKAAERECEMDMVARLAEERRKLDRLRLEFARDRQRFFAAAEAQVVKLALAVAERVLAREVASDGLHLRSAVKAALGRVQESSATRLLVAPGEEAAWKAMFERESSGKVTVVADARVGSGDCVLETNVGRVELGVAVQMEEIERNFAEMLQAQDVPRAGGRGAEEAGGY